MGARRRGKTYNKEDLEKTGITTWKGRTMDRKVWKDVVDQDSPRGELP